LVQTERVIETNKRRKKNETQRIGKSKQETTNFPTRRSCTSEKTSVTSPSAIEGKPAKLTLEARGPYRILEEAGENSYWILKLPAAQSLTTRPGKRMMISRARDADGESSHLIR
jgi:hypothetical protein